MEHLSHDQKDCLNQHENSHNLFNQKGHPVWRTSMETEPTT